MASKARELANLGNAYSDGALSNRNLIINGAMQVAQRGTSFSGHTDGYTVDRWRVFRSGGAAYTVTQSSNAPSGFSKSLRVECSTADAVVDSGDYSIIQYNIEGQDLQHINYGSASAQPITMSFWVRSNVTGIITITNEPNAGPPYLAQHFTISQADTWEYKTLTWIGNTSTSIDDDNTTGIEFQMWLNAGSVFKDSTYNNTTWNDVSGSRVNHSNINLSSTVGNYIEITGVQLEAGDTATPFEHRSYGQELALCQRYFLNMQNLSGSWAFNKFGFGVGSGSTNNYITIPTPVTLRAIPTVSFSGIATTIGSAGTVVTSSTLETANASGVQVTFSGGSYALGDFVYIQGGSLSLSAEL